MYSCEIRGKKNKKPNFRHSSIGFNFYLLQIHSKRPENIIFKIFFERNSDGLNQMSRTVYEYVFPFGNLTNLLKPQKSIKQRKKKTEIEN